MIGPTWLVDDLLRVEELLAETAGSSTHPLVREASLHLPKAGGKRLRPALVLIASRAGESGRRETDLAAAAVELVHVATLYHDDVIDGTETRRGISTAHVKWGMEIAVLTGDYLLARGCSLGAQAGGEVPLLLADAVAEVCEGQIGETAALNDPRRAVEDYVATISLKTGALFRVSCELGATTSGAPRPARDALVDYGAALGTAFQIVDDLLDLVGDPEVTGKIPGTDVREGVFTVPVLLASARDPGLANRLTDGERDLDAILPVLRSTDALSDAFRMAQEVGERATAEAERLADARAREALTTIVQGVLAQVPEYSAA